VAFLAAVAGILGQFDLTRELMASSLKTGLAQIFSGFESLMGTIPNLLLTVILVIAFQASLRVLDLFLKGVSSGRIRWRLVSSDRVPVVRAGGTLLMIVAFGPLIIASFFGRFNTPWETLMVIGAAALALAAVPILASYCVGSILIWKARLHPGDWIEVGRHHGEISKIGFAEIVIVPLEGGSLTIPMLTLLREPIHRVQRPPGFRLHLEVKPTRPVRDILHDIKGLIHADLNPEIELTEVAAEKLSMTVSTSMLKIQNRQELMCAIAEGAAAGKIDLIHCRYT
jgi:small-conductance mechanosensitive channel